MKKFYFIRYVFGQILSIYNRELKPEYIVIDMQENIFYVKEKMFCQSNNEYTFVELPPTEVNGWFAFKLTNKPTNLNTYEYETICKNQLNKVVAFYNEKYDSRIQQVTPNSYTKEFDETIKAIWNAKWDLEDYQYKWVRRFKTIAEIKASKPQHCCTVNDKGEWVEFEKTVKNY